jgi:Na+-driven multidrug efflux pump
MLIYLFPESAVGTFSQNDSKLVEITVKGMKVFMLSLLFEGTVLLTTVYF